MKINSWGPTIQGFLWFSLPRPNTFIATKPFPGPHIPTTLSQKQQLQRRSNTSYPNEIYFPNFTLHKLHWVDFQTKQMACWFCRCCMSFCFFHCPWKSANGMAMKWRMQEYARILGYDPPQNIPNTNITNLPLQIFLEPHQNVMKINAWGPTIQGVLWFSLLRQHTFMALLPPNPSQAHSILTTLSQKQQLQRRSDTSYSNEIYFSNFTLHKLHWVDFQTKQMACWFCRCCMSFCFFHCPWKSANGMAMKWRVQEYARILG